MDQLYDTEPGQPRVPLRATPEGYLIVQIAGGGGGGGSSVTNLTTTVSPTNVVVASDTGTDAVIPAADGTNAGMMLPAQVAKLAGLTQVSVVNDLTTGGTTAALSAEQGTTLKTLVDGKATAAQGAKADAAMPNTAGALATTLEGAATTAPADLARIQASVSRAAAALSRLSTSYRQSRGANPRALSPITLAVAAFGATPAAGTVGYATTGITTTGWTVYDYQLNSSPTPSIYPFRMRAAQHEYTSFGLRNIHYKTAAGTRVAGAGVWSVATNAPEVVIGVVSTGTVQPYSLNVDNRRCSVDINTAAGGILQTSINLRGLSDPWHTIELMLSQDDRIAYLRVPSGYQVVTPPRRPVIAMFTDSLGVTVTGGRAHDSYVAVAADYLGCDIRLFPYGGTGYENQGTGGEIFSARVPLAVPYMPADPIAVILSGGANDAGSAGFEAAVAGAANEAKTRWPSANIVCLGSFGPMTTAGYTAKLALEPRIKTAAQSAGALFVPTLTDPNGAWLRGTGTIESPTGSGVGDRYMSTADVTFTHWVKTGHADVGLMLADGLAAVLGL